MALVVGRDEAAVVRKIGNLKSADPAYTATGKKGLPRRSKLDQPVFATWSDDPEGLRLQAERLRREWSGPIGEPTALLTNGKLSREWVEARTLELQGRTGPQSKVRIGEVAIRMGQDAFAELVLVKYRFAVGLDVPAPCPGCGHARCKANGDPLLEAHHVVPFAERASMDPDFGLPLCPNCHRLCTVGSMDARLAIHARARQAYPAFFETLARRCQEGALLPPHREKLEAEGLLGPP